MPEHVHLLMGEPEKRDPSKILQVLKQKVSQLLREDSVSADHTSSLRLAREIGEAPAFWQRRFYDFNVWSANKVLERLEYMHDNPVKRQPVTDPGDWPWSSWSHYAKKEHGLIAIDALEEKPNPRENPHP